LPNSIYQSVNNIPLSTDCFSLGILLLGSLSNSAEVTPCYFILLRSLLFYYVCIAVLLSVHCCSYFRGRTAG